MAQPLHVWAAGVTTNIAICTLVLPFTRTAAASSGAATSFPATCFDLLSYEIVAGSSGVGTVITFQTLQLNSQLPPAALTWGTLTTGGGTSTPLTITLANSTTYGGLINGPFLGVQMLISGVVGNGVAYARLSGAIRTL